VNELKPTEHVIRATKMVMNDTIFLLDSMQLSNGATLANCKLAVRTHGKLNANKSNAILFPGFLGGSPEALEIWIGEGRPLDPQKYFIILPGQLGIPPSSSPSNTDAPYNGSFFPQAQIADDVILQERMLREMFGITELQLVLGWSVGALQTYEWATRFPGMVRRMASIAGAPRPSAWTRLWLQSVIEEPLTSDRHWAGGNYTDPEALQVGKRLVGHLAALTLPPKAFYRLELWRNLGFSSVDDFVARFWEAFWLPHDPNDLVLQARKARAADPSGGGDLALALAGIRARTMVAALSGDAMFPPDEGEADCAALPNAIFRHIETNSGHLGTFSLSDADREGIDRVIAEILAEAA
jgi:homoserine O-acetyltransferase